MHRTFKLLKSGLSMPDMKKKLVRKYFVIRPSTSATVTNPTLLPPTLKMRHGSLPTDIENRIIVALQSTRAMHEGIGQIVQRHKTTIQPFLSLYLMSPTEDVQAKKQIVNVLETPFSYF